MLKKVPSDIINCIKNVLFFLSRAPTHHSFTFNLRFLDELKRKVPFSKTVCGIFHFRSSFVFIIENLVYTIEKLDTVFLPDLVTNF